MLSGYASLRQFYELRDEQLNSKIDGDSVPDLKERKRQGASALVAAISSASDSIRGGLLDPSINVVIPVDNLVALLGESLVFFEP